MTAPLKKLREIAEAATKGRWKRDYQNQWRAGAAVVSHRSILSDEGVQIVKQPDASAKTPRALVNQQWSDGAHIAAWSPATCLAVLELLELYHVYAEHSWTNIDGEQEILARIKKGLG